MLKNLTFHAEYQQFIVLKLSFHNKLIKFLVSIVLNYLVILSYNSILVYK